MELTTGQEIWLSFAIERSSDGQPFVSVARAVVLDAENRVVKRPDIGMVSVLSAWSSEQAHPTEAAAWRACAEHLLQRAGQITDKAAECHARAAAAAAASSIVAVPA